MNNKEKINLKDIQDGTQNREVPVFIVGDKKWWGDRITKDQIATHADCQDCGVEFEKQYTYQKRCSSCDFKYQNQKYLALELVEWDGKTPLCIYGDDTYFFDQDDIVNYCEDNDVESSQLQLVLCEQSKFGQINIAEQFQDVLHEDWEHDAELERLEKQLNDYLAKASTNTWFATNKRVTVSLD